MKTILLIEDNLSIRENTCELLELEGYKVICASNGKTGLQLAKKELPDIILSDVAMPMMNGHELFAALKKDSSTRDIPFVLLTSSVEKKEIQAALEKGVNGFIGKPFEKDVLFQKISFLLLENNS
ncbi:MAG TPA: response regulator [Saprospiraceae bacterium]|nr:response regulator [Saprospiraceae bacterium]